MTGAEMRFFAPSTIAEATGLLASGQHYRCLAGGGLVVPALREGSPPPGLISLRRVSGLRGIEMVGDGAVRIGAMTPHAEVARSDLLASGLAVVRLAAAEIAHPVIRNMATIGGTLCRADPAADYGCALLAADARVHLRCNDGERVLALEDFAVADNSTVRRDDELLVAVSLPSDTGRGSSGYARFSRVDGDYPVASAAVRLGWDAGVIISARVAIGGCGPAAYLVEDADALLDSVATYEAVPETLAQAAVAAAQPCSDLKGSAEFRRVLIPTLLGRALRQAFAGATP
jgi:carbon-monoxide dehydrogenase medium subunit